jgi:hypothetical protein
MLIKKLPLALLSLVIGISGCYYKMGAKVDTDTIAQRSKRVRLQERRLSHF